MTKIVVADDHDLVRMGIVRMLSDVPHFEVVGEARTGEEAVNLVRQFQPCVVLMDVKMPGIGGLEATRKVLHASPSTKVIAVTAIADDLYSDRILKAGASGYVTKDTGFHEILKAIETVLRGHLYMSNDMAQQVALRSYTGGLERSPFDELSERELQTAVMISNGVKVQKIAESFCISPKTVNSYRYRIFEKLNIDSDVELALLAVKYKLLDIE